MILRSTVSSMRLLCLLGAAFHRMILVAAAEEECGLYLAVSSTSTVEEPKWGLYAGQTIPKGDRIGHGDVAVHTFHMMANSQVLDEETGTPVPDEEDLSDIVLFLEQYIWIAHSTGGQFELEPPGRIVTAIPGSGVLGGYNEKMTNADWNHSITYHRPNWGESPGVTHPGRGASSQHFEAILTATDEIPAGAEIFMNYGDSWEDNQDDNEESEDLTKADFEKVDQTIEKMIEFFAKHEADLDEQSKQEIYQFLIQDIMAAAAGSKKGKKIAALLPESPDTLASVMEDGGSIKLSNPGAMRSVEWLAKHGRCMDNIRPGPSTIPYAGRGAFATRPIGKGKLVAPMPLIQIPNERILDMYELVSTVDEEDEEYFARRPEAELNGTQLLLNYCFGHPDSSLIFLPAGAGTSFINHSPTPNAKLVWSQHPNHHKHWFDLDPDQLIETGNGHLGLLMEVVATRDIDEGEEVTIDYGPDWAREWELHVEAFEAKKQRGQIASSWPIRAIDMNTEYAEKPFEVDATYPDNVMLKCFLMVQKPSDGPDTNEKGESIRFWTDLGRTIVSDNLFDCEVVDRELVADEDGNKEWFYTIRWDNGHDEVVWVHKVPHVAIVFMDRPYTSDLHFEHAFRHFIAIPDDVFPQGPWRNLEDEDEDEEDEDEDED